MMNSIDLADRRYDHAWLSFTGLVADDKWDEKSRSLCEDYD